ncbi:MAG: beta-ketoacyl-ACP synthase III [Cytophagales bacterium]|nr:beta-ketoacyl-ACP synthase III [Armatimonadota bacterium]
MNSVSPTSASASLPVKIAGLGHYLPERRVTSAELEETLGLRPGSVFRTTGVCERRRASRGETNSRMAAAAARQALASADRKVGEVDLILGASASPEQMIPCTAALVQRELDGPEGRSACFDVNATCLSFAVALQVAGSLIASGAYRTILVFSSEVTGESLNPNEPESAALIGDAAAAAVLTRSDEKEASRIHLARFATYSESSHLTQLLGGGALHHPNSPHTTPDMNQFRMHGPAIFRIASRLLPPFVESFLDTVGWTKSSIDLVIPHQASGHALRHLAPRLGFSSDQVFLNLPQRGNCVAASLPLALSEAWEAGHIQRGSRVLLLGTGAGLTLGAVALTY